MRKSNFNEGIPSLMDLARQIDSQSGYKSNKSRDTRRSFTTPQKNEILYQQNNLCAGEDCNHKRLDPRTTRFHHIKPWSEKGRTITTNGAALCPGCHEIVHHYKRLDNVENRSDGDEEEEYEEQEAPKDPFWLLNRFADQISPFGKRR
jgi:hypothetical protein